MLRLVRLLTVVLVALGFMAQSLSVAAAADVDGRRCVSITTKSAGSLETGLVAPEPSRSSCKVFGIKPEPGAGALSRRPVPVRFETAQDIRPLWRLPAIDKPPQFLFSTL